MVIFAQIGGFVRLGIVMSALIGGTTVDGTDATERVKSALSRGSFPWYDAKKDGIQPVKLREYSQPNTGRTFKGWGWGDYLVFGGFVVAFVALAALVFWYWKRFEPTADSASEVARSPSTTLSGKVLPIGLRANGATDDPWAEANRRRLNGDFAGAILCLFAHQLLTLSKMNLVRLAPGRTGRQLHRGVSDAEFQRLMTPTLRQFEAVYYGHRTPSASDFAAVWASAEAFERRAAEGVAR